MAHEKEKMKKNFHMKPCVFTVPDAHSAYK